MIVRLSYKLYLHQVELRAMLTYIIILLQALIDRCPRLSRRRNISVLYSPMRAVKII
jgi:hypothetical protein